MIAMRKFEKKIQLKDSLLSNFL